MGLYPTEFYKPDSENLVQSGFKFPENLES